MFDRLQIPPKVSPKPHYIKYILEKNTTKQTKKLKTPKQTKNNPQINLKRKKKKSN